MASTCNEKVVPVLESGLEPDEPLRGVIAATYQKTFSGAMWAAAIADLHSLILRITLDDGETMAELLAAAHGDPA